MCWFRFFAAVSFLAVLHLATSQQPARAEQFDWRDCSPCPSHEVVRYAYDSQVSDELRANPYAGAPGRWPDFSWADWDYPADVMEGEHYGSAIRDLDHLIYANGNVQEVRFAFSRFELVDGLDKLLIWSAGSPTAEYTGHHPPSTPIIHKVLRSLNPVYPLSSNPILLRFNSLDSYERGFMDGGDFPYNPFLNDLRNYETDDGFRVGLTSVCCNPLTIADWPYLIPTMRHQLLLLGEGDTLFFQYPNDRAGVDSIVAIWENDIAPDARYDIYAKCNAQPSHDNYDLTTFTPQNTETINQALLLHDEMCPVPGTWQIAVHQELGSESGTVNLVVAPHYEARRRLINAGFSWAVTPEKKAQVEASLPEAARFLYGATEGAEVVKTIVLHDTADCDDCAGQRCGLCFIEPNTGASWHNPQTHIVYIKSHHYTRPKLIAHEWAHQHIRLNDEYGSITGCTHSIMGNQNLSNNFCIPGDHTRDTDPGAVYTGPAPTSVWPHDFSPVTIINTPDSYDYYEHPLGGYVGNVQEPSGGGGGSCRAALGPLPSVRHLLVWLSALALCAVQRRRSPARRKLRRSKQLSTPSSSRKWRV